MCSEFSRSTARAWDCGEVITFDDAQPRVFDSRGSNSIVPYTV